MAIFQIFHGLRRAKAPAAGLRELTDDELEEAIVAEHRAMVAASHRGDLEATRAHWERMRELCRRRSPERIERMERERGLK